MVTNLKREKYQSCGCNIPIPYKATDETGRKYNRLTIIEIIREKGCRAKCRCICDCGNEIITDKTKVTTGHTKSCGCYMREKATSDGLRDYSGMISSHGIEILYPAPFKGKCTRPWVCRCSACGEEFIAKPVYILGGGQSSCGCLKRSSKEKMIDLYLQSLGVNFAQQVTFSDCANENTLRFDFGVYNEDNQLVHLIEYDGGQHFFPVKAWGGEETFNKIKRRDEIKNEYCAKNNIPLLRLPYTLTDEEIKQEITNIINPKRL